MPISQPKQITLVFHSLSPSAETVHVIFPLLVQTHELTRDEKWSRRMSRDGGTERVAKRQSARDGRTEIIAQTIIIFGIALRQTDLSRG